MNWRNIDRLKIFLLGSILFLAISIREFIHFSIEEGVWEFSTSRQLFVKILYLLIVLMIILFGLIFTSKGAIIKTLNSKLEAQFVRFKPGALILTIGLMLAFPLFIFSSYGRYFEAPFSFLLVFWVFLWLITWLLRPLYSWPWDDLPLFLVGGVLAWMIYIGIEFDLVNDYPFALQWSEASRYYNGALWASKKVFGKFIHLPHRDPTRYFLQAIPFWLGSGSILFHRFWQVLLRIVFTGLAGWTFLSWLKKRSNTRHWSISAAIFLWVTLFILQAPVFYHVIPMVFLGIWGIRPEKFWRTTIFVVLLSIWAGLSRLNWFAFPGVLAGFLYLLDTPVDDRKIKSIVRYALPIAFWVGIGLLSAFIAKEVYVQNSGLDPGIFSSDFSSELIWERLFPGLSNPRGVLTELLAVTLPVSVAAIFVLFRRMHLGWLRNLGIISVLSVFLAGGLIVSAKIGGGTNLHNLDLFFIFLALLALYTGTIRERDGRNKRQGYQGIPQILLIIIFWIPIFYQVYNYQYIDPFDNAAAEKGMERLKYYESISGPESEILFISNKHLTAFGYFENTQLKPEYDKLLLMEMVMGKNREYLDKFQSDMKNQVYDVIISDPVYPLIKDPAFDALSEENNAYIREVGMHLLCYYDADRSYRDSVIAFFVRSETPCENPEALLEYRK